MKPHEVIQPRSKEEFASNRYRVEIDTMRVAAADLFNPDYWVNNTVLKKGDIIRCVAKDGSYAFDLIVTSQKLDATKSVKNLITVAMFPRLTEEVLLAAEASAADYAVGADDPVPVADEPVPATPKPTQVTPADRPGQFSHAKREKKLSLRAELDAKNKARTAERLAAEAAENAA
jgi:hypothetical protein